VGGGAEPHWRRWPSGALLCHSQWDDIDLANGVLHVRRTWARTLDGSFAVKATKTEKSARSIPLTPEAVEALSDRRRRQEDLSGVAGTDPVFTDAAGERIDTTELAPRLRGLLRQAGLPTDMRFHDLRHSTATLWLAAGVDVKTVADLLGHSTPVITMTVYASSAGSARFELVAGLLRTRKCPERVAIPLCGRHSPAGSRVSARPRTEEGARDGDGHHGTNEGPA
jgi:integrase